MEITFDPEADAVYVSVRPGVPIAEGIDLDDRRRIDLGADGQPVGLEFLGVQEGIDLTNIPNA